MPARRRPQVGRPKWWYAGELQTRFLDHYQSHPPFRKALVRLYRDHCAGHEDAMPGWTVESLWPIWDYVRPNAQHPHADWARAYLRAVFDLAAAFGLNRFQRSGLKRFAPSKGEEMIGDWCAFSARSWRERGADPNPEWFISMIGFGGGMPDIGEVVAHQAHEYVADEDEGIPTRWVVVEEERRPVVRVQIEGEWHPEAERRVDARDRLLKLAVEQIDAGLEQLAAEYESQGGVFPDKQPQLQRDIKWLFEHVALGRSVGDIAAAELVGRDLGSSVYNRIKERAREIGVTLGPVSATTV